MVERVKRVLSIARKRTGKLRRVIPSKLIRLAKYGENELNRLLKHGVQVKKCSEYDNIYHAGLQKTGTQWIFDILSDPVVYKYSGMTVNKVDIPRRKSQAHEITSITDRYNKNTIVSGFAGTFKNYTNDIPKEGRHNAVFFVIRDPREMVISWYFSTKNNHLIDRVSMMNVIRQKLRRKSKKAGLKYTIELFDWKGKFDVMRSWNDKGRLPNVKLVKFEQLTQKSLKTFRNLFEFLDINIPEDELRCLVSSYSFETLTGRKKGAEDKYSHMRSGKSNSWRKHFDDDLRDLFDSKAGDLVDKYGYSE